MTRRTLILAAVLVVALAQIASLSFHAGGPYEFARQRMMDSEGNAYYIDPDPVMQFGVRHFTRLRMAWTSLP